MSEKVEHTPTPWSVREFAESNMMITNTTQTDVAEICFWDGEPHEIKEAKANADFIVTACNHHATLKSALEKLVARVDSYEDKRPLTKELEDARAALRAIEEEK